MCNGNVIIFHDFFSIMLWNMIITPVFACVSLLIYHQIIVFFVFSIRIGFCIRLIEGESR